MSSSNSPQTEESGLQPLILSIPQSQSTQQSSEAKDQVHNVVPSLFLSLPAVLIHPYDDPDTTKDEFEDSNKPNQSLHEQKDDSQLEILTQVPFKFGQPSLAGFPDTPYIQEKGMKGVEEKEDIEENYGTLEDILEEPSQNIEDKSETNFHMLEEAKQPPSSNEVNNSTEDMEKLSLSKNLKLTLEEHIQEQKVGLVSSVQVETTKVVDVESTKLDDEETNVLEASCWLHSHLGTTRQDRETQSLLVHLTSDKPPTMQHQLEEGIVLDLSVIDSVLHEDPELDSQNISMHTPTSKEKPKLVIVSETSASAFDLQPSPVHSSAEDDYTFEGDEPSSAPYKTCKDSETQHTLPRDGTELSQISKDQPEVTLYTCLMVSVTFFSAVICLAVGIQEPSSLLYMGLFLLSLWFWFLYQFSFPFHPFLLQSLNFTFLLSPQCLEEFQKLKKKNIVVQRDLVSFLFVVVSRVRVD